MGTAVRRALALLASGVAAAFAAPGCATTLPPVYAVRTLASGSRSGFPLATQRVFRSREALDRFTAPLRERDTFPAELPEVDWTREMVVAVFGGESEPFERVQVLRAQEISGSLLVLCRKHTQEPDAVFDDAPRAPIPRDASAEKTTPFVLAALPRFDGAVRFVLSQGLGGS